MVLAGFVLLTTKMMDAIYEQAAHRVLPEPMTAGRRCGRQTTTAVTVRSSRLRRGPVIFLRERWSPAIDYAPWGHVVFGTTVIGWTAWNGALPFGAALLVLDGLWKRRRRPAEDRPVDAV
jgi:hypothetical protein